MIAILLLKWLLPSSKAKWVPVQFWPPCCGLNLFTYRDLRNWLDDPFETPPPNPWKTESNLPWS